MTYDSARVMELLGNVRQGMLDAAPDDERSLVEEFNYVWLIGPCERFLQLHPSGFYAAGFEFMVHPATVVETTRRYLETAGIDEYVLSVGDWLYGTVLSSAEGWSNDTILLHFSARCPDELVMLGAIATCNGYDLPVWLFGRTP